MKLLFKFIYSLFSLCLFPLIMFKGLFLFLIWVTIGFWKGLLCKK